MLADDNQIDTVIESFQKNIELWSMLRHRICVDEKRWHVLRGIAAGFAVRENEELRNEIYLYGSMLKGSDLLGRQIFLWLLHGLDEAEMKEEAVRR